MKNFVNSCFVPGIPDEQFIRDKVPMTKEEIRTVTLSKLRPNSADIIYDIGAGSGSISVECSLLAPEGKVYAIERNPKATELIAKNKQKFKCANLEIIRGLAPKALTELPPPHKVVIGGSGGNLEEILELLDKKLLPKGRIVINAILLETLSAALNYYQAKSNYKVEFVQMAISKAERVADLNMMKAYNPIYIITAEKNNNQGVK